ncbi:hypothetical protein [Chitinophaga nivalis]|uniref:Anti sigma-E protein RseA N-terminal domain-containing protein n=1 Tax=Chitinophaga nivalis TaxID=2991709 RepID=A0ABT3IVN8_9BACT|nr:hypothetical protein [Chitinophaga nivalis]MCW3462257.1 hypothetical protein [Chitinophaga nivalis]MCW3488051.1 hypothetical protein [Chitinophaga nivalis]
MNIQEYIESGIIERYLLGLATPEQEAELHHLRRRFPLLETEIAAAEVRIEKQMLGEAVLPPIELKGLVFRHIREDNRYRENDHRQGHNGNGHTRGGPTYINIQPGWNRNITVSIWWRCAFIALVVLVMSLAASTWYLYQRTTHLEEILLQSKFPATAAPAPGPR